MPSDRRPRILFVQFTNPAGYPPLEHASRILAGRGWSVLFLGTGADAADGLRFPAHPAIRERRMPWVRPGVLQKIAYAAYVGWVLAACALWRPRWIYASDPMAALPALMARALLRRPVVYHEHDSPARAGRLGPMQRLFRWARLRLARRADLVVLPQRRRLEAFLAETGRTGPALMVWNCPRRDEIAPPRPAVAPGPLRFYYHGSLNEVRLPFHALKALALACPEATLTVVGYETVGSRGYLDRLMGHAAGLGLADRVRYRGAVPTRAAMLREAAQADVGLAFMPAVPGDINLAHMAGASNKAFDYLAVGAMPLVSDLPNWRAMYVAPGFARACDPSDVQSLAAAFAWCIAHPEEVRAAGERGRQMVAREWNYETQFAPVVERLDCVSVAERHCNGN